jgi:DNA-binding transcriptional MocR family regulator
LITSTDTVLLILTIAVCRMKEHLYLKIAEMMEQQIIREIWQAGHKLPSLRVLCREHGVSQSTALQAYYYLESKSLIESRPQSGYFVCYAPKRFPRIPQVSKPEHSANREDTDELISKVYDQQGPEYNVLSLGIPAAELLPIARLNKGLIKASRELNGSGTTYEQVRGNEKLRRQVAHRTFAMNEQDIIITAGCVEAITYGLKATTETGDTIAVESPVSFGMLQLARSLGLRVMELPTHPVTGIEIAALQKALQTGNIKVVLLISNFSNPLGSCMPGEHKKEVVRLLEKYGIPLIENDINGDLYFGAQRPGTCKSYDQSGLVLWCSSISKTLAPGYRVGWIAAGKFRDKVIKMKLYQGIASTAITQEVIADFLETGRYEHHLRKLRSTLHANSLNYVRAIADYFPEGTMASRPAGGAVLWVELLKQNDTLRLYEKAMRQQISFAPGRLFTLQKQFDNCMRLNYALPWTAKLENTLKILGRLAGNN